MRSNKEMDQTMPEAHVFGVRAGIKFTTETEFRAF